VPTIIAKRAGRCTAAGCGGRIRQGEHCDFSDATGTRHLECRDTPAERRNDKPGPCARCGRRLGKGEGLLTVEERQVGGEYRKRYVVTCVTVCSERGET
jgi:hypothetical protein